MNILFIGDVMGQPGRAAVTKLLPELRKTHNVDLVIANGENLAHGKGSTRKTIQELLEAGVDLVTSGNHWADQTEMLEVANDTDVPFIRPANYPVGTPGRGYTLLTVRTQKVLVINLMGRVYMKQHFSDPFRGLDEILTKTSHEKPDVVIVDFHADATGEAVAFGYFADGKVTAVLGTHTHVPTADATVLSKGTGYVTDVGMVGPRNSVLGMDPEAIIRQHMTQLPTKLEIAQSNEACFNFAVVHVSDSRLASGVRTCGSIIRQTKIVEL
jgi:metallophosphoesterase (TIGR00282 family)